MTEKPAFGPAFLLHFRLGGKKSKNHEIFACIAIRLRLYITLLAAGQDKKKW
jgi:hypothetical protein